MKLVIFGATGRTGKELVQQALEQGNEVTAYVRNPQKLGMNHARLKVVQGEMNEPDKLAQAVQGQDAVLSGLGPVGKGPKDIMETSAKNIVAAMKKTGVRRLVTVTGAGVAQPGDEPKAFNKFMSFMLGLMAKDVILDSTRHAEVVRGSGLDWTIVRVPVLADGPKQGKHKVGVVGVNDGARINRADVADFMLKQVASPEHVGKAPVIAY